ncbi:MAG: hypothetical protein AB1657_03290 [Candidatus Micrarchaeota archaeon]
MRRALIALVLLALLSPVNALSNINNCTNISYSDDFVLTGNIAGNSTYPPFL